MTEQMQRIVGRGYLAYLFVTFVLHDFSKFPANYSGVVAPADFVGMMTAVLAIVAVGAYVRYGWQLRVQPLALLTVLSFLAIWVMTVFMYDPSVIPSYPFREAGETTWPGYLAAFGVVVKFAIGLLLVPLYFARFVSPRGVFLTIVAAASVHAVMGLYQFGFFIGMWADIFPMHIGWFKDGQFFSVFGRSTGFLTNPFPFATFLQLAALLCLAHSGSSRPVRWRALGVALVLVSMLSLSKSLIVGWLVVALLYVPSSRHPARYVTTIAAVIVLGVVTYFTVLADLPIIAARAGDTASLDIRLATNAAAWESFTRSPLIGYGVGYYFVTDSMFATLLLEGGLLRFLTYVAFWLWLVVELRQVEARTRENGDAERLALAGALRIFILALLLQSAFFSTVERMPVMLAISSLFFALSQRVRVPSVARDRETPAHSTLMSPAS